LSVGVAATELTDRPLTVLDFGGGCGFHYFRVVAAIRTSLRWGIVETPIMAERAAKVAQGRFEVFSDIATAAEALSPFDLVHASGSLSYAPDPLSTLRALAGLRARYFALARFPMWSGPTTVGVQKSRLSGNGIGPMPPKISDRHVQYPITFINWRDVLTTLNTYEVALAIDSPSGAYMVCGRPVQGGTVILRLRELPSA
jgi:putative methyltransferase (TIGR04325 family)